MTKQKISPATGIGRILVLWIAGVLGLLFMTWLDPAISVDSIETAFIVVAVIGILNAVLWPILTRFTLPFLVATFGAGLLLLNAFILWLASELVDGFTVSGWAYITTPIVMAAITTIISSLLTIDDDASYFRSVLKKRIRQKKVLPVKDHPGILFTEIDGLSLPILERALNDGYMPTLKRWLDQGAYKIRQWEPDLSSQTGASQAGILHGNNKNMPAFRWVEKENNNKIVASNGAADAPALEARISNGRGLLSSHGASRSNLFSGDAENVIFTYSKLTDLKRFYNRSWYFFFSHPENFPRTIALFLWDVFLELSSRLRQWLMRVQPRLNRGLTYIAARAGANIFMREVTTFTVVGDVLEGQLDAIYATYYGYDEVAHHSGIADHDVFGVLKQLDKQFKRIESARDFADRDYTHIILSDHGQSNGATFKQRYGYTLEELARRLLPADQKVYSVLSSNEDHWEQAFSQPLQDPKNYFSAKVDYVEARTLHWKNSLLRYIQKEKVEVPSRISRSAEEANIVVLASGNLGLIYFTDHPERLTYEQIKSAFPQLIPGMVQHEGVGFILVRSQVHGPLAIGADGIYYLAEDRAEGKNPLESFGENAARHLGRTDSFKYVPDILVNSFYDEESGEVAAFEELIGSHGGLGGSQTHPFIMYPSRWNLGKEEIIGAEKVYQIFQKKMEDLRSE